MFGRIVDIFLTIGESQSLNNGEGEGEGGGGFRHGKERWKKGGGGNRMKKASREKKRKTLMSSQNLFIGLQNVLCLHPQGAGLQPR